MEKMQFTFVKYQDFLSKKELMGSRCKKCARIFLPPRPICKECSCVDMEWIEIQGEGRLVAFTVIAVGPTLMIEEGYNRMNPYCTGIVELKEGPRISARIEGFDLRKIDSIKIGSPVKIAYPDESITASRKAFLVFKAL